MSASPEPVIDQTAHASWPSTPVQSFWRSPTFIVVLLFALIWMLVMAFRWELRAQWWAYQATQAASPADRDFYITRLASIGDRSLNALPLLLDHADPNVRMGGITILRYCASPRALDMLIARLGDAEPDVAGSAATAIAWRPKAAQQVPRLVEAAAGRSAWGVAVALGRVGGKQAQDALQAMLATQPDASVKAQVIDSLGLLGCKEALPLMHKSLEDARPIDRLPHSQLSAMRAIGALSPELAAKGIDPMSAADSASTSPTVAAVAGRWIRLLSGITTSSSPVD